MQPTTPPRSTGLPNWLCSVRYLLQVVIRYGMHRGMGSHGQPVRATNQEPGELSGCLARETELPAQPLPCAPSRPVPRRAPQIEVAGAHEYVDETHAA
jgi:hypothetical protein